MNYLKEIIEKNYPEIKYTEDKPVESILRYFQAGCVLSEQNKFIRLKHDCDAYFYEDENGDVMFSFWQPYKWALYQETGFSYSKTTNSLKHLLNRIDNQKIKSINKKFNNFAKLCYTKGNFILLPDRAMQKRGILYEDRIDETLYECFANGVFEKHFKNITIEEWIKREKLELLFHKNIINKDSIVPIIKPKKFTNFCMSLYQIYNYIDKAVDIIKSRTELF